MSGKTSLIEELKSRGYTLDFIEVTDINEIQELDEETIHVLFCEAGPLNAYHGITFTGLRSEYYDQARIAGEKLRKAYTDLGYNVHTLKFTQAFAQKADAAEAILDQITCCPE